MTIKQQGGVFGRNPTFNDVTIEGQLTFDGDIDINSDLKVNGNLDVIEGMTVDADTLVVDAVNNRVGMGTATPSFELHLARNGAGIFVESLNSAPPEVRMDSTIRSWTQYVDTTGNYIFRDRTGSKTVLEFTTAGNLAVSNGNGIDFSATAQAPGSTSELFDDYEEGTWSPVYVPQIGSFATMTMDISNAKYTKIGRFVYVQASILTDSVDITGGSGGLRLSGFPFASSGFGSFVISYAQAWGGDVPLYGYIENASTYANLRYRTSVNGADSAMLVSDLTNGAVANQNYMIISGVYTA